MDFDKERGKKRQGVSCPQHTGGEMVEKTRDAATNKRNPQQEMRCVVHDRVWVFEDILLVDGLDSGCTVANVKARVNELKNIPGGNLEVVIFFVSGGGGGDRSSSAGDDSSTAGGSTAAEGSSSSGGSTRHKRNRAPRDSGPISVCLWKPIKSGREKRYLATVAANPA